VIELGWGAHPLALPAGLVAEVLPPPAPPAAPDLAAALAAALDQPVGSRPLREAVTARTRAVVIVSDASRAEPRAELYAAVRRELAALPDAQITLAVANGTHRPGDPAALGLPPEVLARHRLVNHDGHDPAAVVEMGRTSRGTRLRVDRCVAEADLIVTTGRIAPHAFAGYGGGAMGIYPGLGFAEDVHRSHRLGADPASSLGRADLNPCREDLEEAVRRLGRDTFVLDVVAAGGAIMGAVAGDLVLAHREGVRRLRPWVEVEAARADVVIVSAPLPVSGNLSRASRLVPPAGLLLEDGGVIILAAECPDGLGPVALADPETFALGVRRYLPARSTLLLVSSLDAATVAGSFARHAPSLEAALEEARRLTGPGARVLVLPDAADLVPIPTAAR
jgi:nickel-dependent lactate racemase